MRNFKITVSYDGTRYSGWEAKKGQDTIQGKLEGVLSRMTEQEVKVIGAGRTDAGVHALGAVCNVHLDTERSAEEIGDYLNRYLPEDIAVTDVKEVSDRFHARYNCCGKTYRYTLYVGKTKPVFDRKYAWSPEGVLDVARMRKAASLLTGTHDYRSFCGNSKMKKSTVRTVDRIDIMEEGDRLRIYFHGDGFLTGMVRILTGTLVETGRGEREPEEMTAILAGKDRQLAGVTAPAQGLCLMEVEYN